MTKDDTNTNETSRDNANNIEGHLALADIAVERIANCCRVITSTKGTQGGPNLSENLENAIFGHGQLAISINDQLAPIRSLICHVANSQASQKHQENTDRSMLIYFANKMLGRSKVVGSIGSGGEEEVNSESIESKQVSDALQCATLSTLLEVLICLTEGEEQPLLEDDDPSNLHQDNNKASPQARKDKDNPNETSQLMESAADNLKSGENSVNSKHIEIKQAEDALQCAPRSKLLEALIYLNKAEEKRLLEDNPSPHQEHQPPATYTIAPTVPEYELQATLSALCDSGLYADDLLTVIKSSVQSEEVSSEGLAAMTDTCKLMIMRILELVRKLEHGTGISAKACALELELHDMPSPRKAVSAQYAQELAANGGAL